MECKLRAKRRVLFLCLGLGYFSPLAGLDEKHKTAMEKLILTHA